MNSPRRISSAGSCEENAIRALIWPGSDLLSRGFSRSTIGAEGLNGRVRNGVGCLPLAMATKPDESANASLKNQFSGYWIESSQSSD